MLNLLVLDIKPVEIEPCSASCPPPHPPREIVAPVKEVDRIESEELEPEKYEIFHSWNTEKFSPCSASCGGGEFDKKGMFLIFLSHFSVRKG